MFEPREKKTNRSRGANFISRAHTAKRKSPRCCTRDSRKKMGQGKKGSSPLLFPLWRYLSSPPLQNPITSFSFLPPHRFPLLAPPGKSSPPPATTPPPFFPLRCCLCSSSSSSSSFRRPKPICFCKQRNRLSFPPFGLPDPPHHHSLFPALLGACYHAFERKGGNPPPKKDKNMILKIDLIFYAHRPWLP